MHVPASRERYCSMSTTGWSSAATVTTGQGGDRGLRGALVPSSRCRWPAVLLWWRSSSLGSGLCQEWENEIQTGARCVPRPKSRPLRRVPGPGQCRPPGPGQRRPPGLVSAVPRALVCAVPRAWSAPSPGQWVFNVKLLLGLFNAVFTLLIYWEQCP